MLYRVQFLDGLDNVIREVQTDAKSATAALFRRSVNRACPPHGVRTRVLDKHGHGSIFRNLGPELLS